MHYLDILNCRKFKNSPLGPNPGGAFGSHKMYKMSCFHCLKSWNVWLPAADHQLQPSPPTPPTVKKTAAEKD